MLLANYLLELVLFVLGHFHQVDRGRAGIFVQGERPPHVSNDAKHHLFFRSFHSGLRYLYEAIRLRADSLSEFLDKVLLRLGGGLRS